MLPQPLLRAPFFEIGPKAYLVGDEVLDLARAADLAAREHGVQVLFTSPLLDINRVVAATKNLVVCAPHMDPIQRGRGLADILPEAVRSAGAHAVMLNHAERPISYSVLEATMRRAAEVGLMTVVCASSMAEIRAVALLAPDVIVAEPTELIGSGQTSDLGYMQESSDAVRSINPRILVLQAAGISSGEDVERVMALGADATGSSSGIARAADRNAMVNEMIAAARRGFDSATSTNHHQEKDTA